LSFFYLVSIGLCIIIIYRNKFITYNNDRVYYKEKLHKKFNKRY
jgi:hypothetical protein